MKTPGVLIAALAFTLLPLTAQAQAGRALHFLAKQCDEDAITVRLDPRALQEYVGAEHPLVLEDGKARVLVVVHDCGQYWMDGESVGPTQETQIWVAVQGLDDVRPVLGAERTLPTRTWFSLFSGSTNRRVRDAKGAAGTAQAAILGVRLSAPAAGRSGRLALGSDLEYSWDVGSAAPAQVRLLGMNQDVFVRDAGGGLALNRIQVLLRVAAAPAPATLHVLGRTDALPLLPAGSYPASVLRFSPMWSRATLGFPPAHGRQAP